VSIFSNFEGYAVQFMVEFQLEKGSKNQALEAFEQRGPNRTQGVAFRGAWIGKESEIVFVLVECADEKLLATAGESWSAWGSFRVHPVIDIQQY
jgi:hypothetical protein